MVKKAEINDVKELASLAVLMWENHTVEDLMDEFSAMVTRDNVQFFLTYHKQVPVGFAQCQLRYDYVEGIFVLEEYRHHGYAREKGCKEFASDCELDNKDSYAFHMAMNFEEANRIVCFTKKL